MPAGQHRAEAVLVAGAREDLQDPLGPRVGGDVPVADGQAQQRVADAATHEVAAVPGVPQRAQHGHRLGGTGNGWTLGVHDALSG